MRPLGNQIHLSMKMALSTLMGNKLHSSLTVLGVMVGVWTVVSIASVISGIDAAVKKEIENLGTNSIFLNKFDAGIRFGKRSSRELARKDLTGDDAEAIARLPTVKVSVPFLNVTNDYFGHKILVAANGKTSAAVRLEGTSPDYINTGLEALSEGRFFTQFENDTHQEVCVMHSGAAKNFFPFSSPVSKTIKIGGTEFRIVGVFERRESLLPSSGGSDDFSNSILMPFNVARKLKPGVTEVTIVAIAYSGRLEEAQDQIIDLLRTRRRVPFDQPNNFGVSTGQSLIANFRSITFGIAVVMVLLSSIGLIVGGVGVMNVMLVSVTERTQEIGMRKAIGARRRDILWQFLLEAMTLTGVGGLTGLTLGWLTTFLVNIFVYSHVPLWAPIAGVFTSVGIGLLFGMWPAWRAARLSRIDAIRYE